MFHFINKINVILFISLKESLVKLIKNDVLKLVLIVFSLITLIIQFNYSHFFKFKINENTLAKSSYTTNISISTYETAIFPDVSQLNILKSLSYEFFFFQNMNKDLLYNPIKYKPPNSLIIDKNYDLDISNFQNHNLVYKDLITFFNLERIVYNGKNTPDTVIVTLLNINNFSNKNIIEIIKNRLDISTKNKHGLYIRWLQEYIFDDVIKNNAYSEEQKKFFCIRSAMHSFPKTKWFWYIDERLLITDPKNYINKKLFESNLFKRIIKESGPFMVNNKLFYNNDNLNDVKMFFLKNNSKIDLSSFLVKNDLISKIIVETINSPLTNFVFKEKKLDVIFKLFLLQYNEINKKINIINKKFFFQHFKVKRLIPYNK